MSVVNGVAAEVQLRQLGHESHHLDVGDLTAVGIQISQRGEGIQRVNIGQGIAAEIQMGQCGDVELTGEPANLVAADIQLFQLDALVQCGNIRYAAVLQIQLCGVGVEFLTAQIELFDEVLIAGVDGALGQGGSQCGTFVYGDPDTLGLQTEKVVFSGE